MAVPPNIYGHHQVTISVRAYDSFGGGTLVRKELSAGYFYSEKVGRRLTFLGAEGDSLWIQPDPDHNYINSPLPTLLVYRSIRGNLHVSPLVFEDGGGEVLGNKAVFTISDKRKVVLSFPNNDERLKLKYTDYIESPIDDLTTIKLIWEIECTKVSADGPPQQYIEEGVDTQEKENCKPGPVLDKHGKKAQCCRGCGKPRLGHLGRLGKSCKAAKPS